MKTNHFSEEEIQQYLFEKSADDPMLTEHMQQCENCRHRMQAYHIFFTAVASQEKPDFDFDLSEAVMSRLNPVPKKQLMLQVFVVLTCMVSGIFLGSILLFFGEQFGALFAGLESQVLIIPVFAVAAISVFQLFEKYRTFQKNLGKLKMG